jgi:amidophosphoribosyltransferase
MADDRIDTSLFREADDHFHDECGVFGIFGRQDAAAIVTLGLHALQHRGQEAAGIVSFDGSQFHVERHVGLIGDTFTKQAVIDSLKGNRAIGHTRYATTGGAGLRNVQPFFAELAEGGLAIAHNGNITNAMTVQRTLQKQGAIFSSTSDTETILHLVAMSKERDINARFIDAVRQLEGAFSLVALTSKKMIGCRDPLGIRPLVLGDLDGAWILASETCALDIIGARFVRDLKPGEMVVVTSKGIESIFRSSRQIALLHLRICLFRPAGFLGRRPQRLRRAQEDRRRTRHREPGRRRHCRAGARFRHAGGDRLQRRRPAFPSSSASSATTMSAAPSSSRAIRSATWASS